jgi:hypothetical protein
MAVDEAEDEAEVFGRFEALLLVTIGRGVGALSRFRSRERRDLEMLMDNWRVPKRSNEYNRQPWPS